MLRNLLHLIRNFKAAFILNLLGLAVAFTAIVFASRALNEDGTN